MLGEKMFSNVKSFWFLESLLGGLYHVSRKVTVAQGSRQPQAPTHTHTLPHILHAINPAAPCWASESWVFCLC